MTGTTEARCRWGAADTRPRHGRATPKSSPIGGSSSLLCTVQTVGQSGHNVRGTRAPRRRPMVAAGSRRACRPRPAATRGSSARCDPQAIPPPGWWWAAGGPSSPWPPRTAAATGALQLPARTSGRPAPSYPSRHQPRLTPNTSRPDRPLKRPPNPASKINPLGSHSSGIFVDNRRCQVDCASAPSNPDPSFASSARMLTRHIAMRGVGEIGAVGWDARAEPRQQVARNEPGNARCSRPLR